MGQISYFVPTIKQGDNPICWIACVAMITSWKRRQSVGIGDFTGGFDPSSSCIPDPNASWEDLYANLNRFGFNAEGSNSTISPSAIEQTLRRHGPFMIFVMVMDFPFFGPMCVNMGGSPTDTHAIVVRGINTTTRKVQLVNPWGTNVPPVDLDVVIDAMQAIANTASHPMAYMR
jgi:hypothetical protein